MCTMPIQLESAASRWQELQQETEQAKTALIEEVRICLDQGMSEYEAARRVKVQRMTIRKWMGKA